MVRYGAGRGTLRRVDMQATLEPALGAIYYAGWTLSWQAVRRRLNTAADTVATRGVLWAAQLAAQGHHAIRRLTHWYHDI